MNKLEEILRAEEAARHAVADAREKADAIVREADANARTIVETARAEAAAQAAETREAVLVKARAQASDIDSSAASELAERIAAARDRVPRATEAVLTELLG